MMGRNHVIVNYAMIIAGTVSVASGLNGPVSQYCEDILRVLYPAEINSDFIHGFTYNMPIFLFMSMLCLWFGSLLPDIDSKSSMLGRYLYLPLKHRTWTHSIWFVILIFLLARLHVWFRFICLGYCLHLIMDSVSTAGICFLYPVKRYKEYPNGAFIAPGHRIKLYHTKDGSEQRFVILVIIVSCIVCFVDYLGFVNFFNWIYY